MVVTLHDGLPASVTLDTPIASTLAVPVAVSLMIAIGAADVDQLQIGLAGAASARIGGKVLKLTAIVRGSSILDGEALTVKDAVIGAQGPAIIKLTATGTAKVDAIGVSSVTLAGNPSCSVTTKGSASVTGCR